MYILRVFWIGWALVALAKCTLSIPSVIIFHSTVNNETYLYNIYIPICTTYYAQHHFEQLDTTQFNETQTINNSKTARGYDFVLFFCSSNSFLFICFFFAFLPAGINSDMSLPYTCAAEAAAPDSCFCTGLGFEVTAFDC